MKAAAPALLMAVATATDAETNPVAKVLDMISGLQSKVIGEGEEAQKAYDEYSEWCEDGSKNLQFEIKTGKANVASLKASIAEESANIEAQSAKIEELASSIATDEADLTSATEIRAKESADFAAEEKELSDVIDTLGRAIGILEREMAKGGAAMVQLKNAGSVVQALTELVQASLLSSADSSRLTALVQTSADSDDDEEAAGSPAAAVYEGHSGGILDVLGDLSEKATAQLDDARKKETAALHNFDMLKQSLEDQIKFAKADTDAAKKSMSESDEKKAAAEGDLDVTSKALAEDVKALSGLHQDCMKKAESFESETKSRGEELKALAEAKKIISETTSGATEQSYSFLQVSRSKLATKVDLANFEAVRYVRDLAHKEKSAALAQLASRMASAMRLSIAHGSSDPFAKVKGLIEEMLAKLESEAEADATLDAFCNKEYAESKEKKEDHETEIAKLSTKIDQMSAKSAQLKEEVATLQKELADLAKSQAEMDKLRQEEKALYDKNQPEMAQGLEGIKLALKVLRDYYAKSDKSHSSADGASSGIVGLLEVCESDFSKGLAEMVATEEEAAAQYESETKENEIEEATKSKDAEYKKKEYVGLDKAVATASSDRSGVQTELDAVVEYIKQLDDKCIAKVESYAERKRRREAELAGLKEALTILENEAALVQESSTRRLRGVKKHA
jgi:uncharacterized protein YlxW (UPF0749 family)